MERERELERGLEREQERELEQERERELERERERELEREQEQELEQERERELEREQEIERLNTIVSKEQMAFLWVVRGCINLVAVALFGIQDRHTFLALASLAWIMSSIYDPKPESQ